MEEDYIETLDLTEEDVKKTKYMYEEFIAKEPEKESELSLEDFTYLIFEFGLLNFRIKTDLERLIEIKKYVGMNSKREEFALEYLNISLKHFEEDVDEDIEE